MVAMTSVELGRELERVRRQLGGYREQLQEEIDRVDRVLASFDDPVGEPGPTAVPIEDDTTVGMLRMFFRANPERSVDAPRAHKAIVSMGWKTTADDPVNAVRAALSDLYRQNEIKRVSRGFYQWIGVGSVSDTTRAETEKDTGPDGDGGGQVALSRPPSAHVRPVEIRERNNTS